MDFKLRLIEKSDLDFVAEIRSDPEVVKNLGTFVMLNKEKQLKWFSGLEKDKSKMYLIMERPDGKKRIGYVRITDIDYINRSMCIGGDIHKDHRGKGYSKYMYDLIFDLGFKKLNMHRLWLLVLEDNDRAKHIYTTKGFILEGEQRKAVYKNGKYKDYLMMSMLRGEYGKL